MAIRIGIVLALLAACVLTYVASTPTQACCPAPPSGKPVVNADQTVVIIWDADTKMQHFIRKASFKSDANDFGFLVPSPSQPELAESGNEAFPYLRKLTEPEVKKVSRPANIGCGCSSAIPERKAATPGLAIKVLEEKMVAGFQASVLEASSTVALVKWLEENGYAFSPEVEAWAKLYVEAGWKITALKVARSKEDIGQKPVNAAALRISFKTERPLFPYREPDYKNSAELLGAKHRLLRIYFLADARYQGELTKDTSWSGKVAWAGKIAAEDRKQVLEHLKLPATTGPAEWWLTEFEDNWPYKVAPADVYFSRSLNQDALKREPIIQYVTAPYPTDAAAYVFTAVVLVPGLLRWRRKLKS
jgi:hypothetical protein